MNQVTPLGIGVNIYRMETRQGNVYGVTANNLDEAETLISEHLKGTGDLVVKTKVAIKGGNKHWDW